MGTVLVQFRSLTQFGAPGLGYSIKSILRIRQKERLPIHAEPHPYVPQQT